jgi:hypothetical protein
MTEGQPTNSASAPVASQSGQPTTTTGSDGRSPAASAPQLPPGLVLPPKVLEFMAALPMDEAKKTKFAAMAGQAARITIQAPQEATSDVHPSPQYKRAFILSVTPRVLFITSAPDPDLKPEFLPWRMVADMEAIPTIILYLDQMVRITLIDGTTKEGVLRRQDAKTLFLERQLRSGSFLFQMERAQVKTITLKPEL